MIWVYDQSSREPEFVWSWKKCAFCGESLKVLHSASEKGSAGGKGHSWFGQQLRVCTTCGWWIAHGWRTVEDLVHREDYDETYGKAACLRDLDLSDLSTPIADVRAYLTARYERRSTLHPRLFEETVASVFADHGYAAVVTAYSGDGGIDVILERGTETVGVQVKRYEKKIEVEQIRSLAGALLLRGMTAGMYVTTSRFRRGAAATVNDFATRGYRIELIDATRFYAALKLAQRNAYKSFAQFPKKDVLDDLPRLSSRVRYGSDRWSHEGDVW